MMENEIRNTVPVSYTKCLWAFACFGGAVPFWLLMLLGALSNLSFDNLLTDWLKGFYFSVLAVPAALATALWARRRNWRRNIAGCLKTVGAGGVCAGLYLLMIIMFFASFPLFHPQNHADLWDRESIEIILFFSGIFSICGMVSAAVLSVLFLPKPDQ